MDAGKRARAAALLAELLGDDVDDLIVGELLDRYLTSPEFPSLRAWKTERARIGHLREHLGMLRVSELSHAVIDDYRTKRAGELGHVKGDGTGRPTAPATRNREVKRLIRILNWALERKFVPTNPIAKCRAEDEPPPRQTRITSADVDLLREGALHFGRDPRIGLTFRAMIATKYDAFLRRSELCALRWPMLDFTAGSITLDLAETKARRAGARITILTDRAASDIREAPRYLGSPWVFTNTRGQRYHPRTFLRMVQAIARAVGVRGAEGENFVGHDLRGGGITDQIEIGTPDRETADMAGWASTAMLERYHRRRGAQAAARAKARLERFRTGQ